MAEYIDRDPLYEKLRVLYKQARNNDVDEGIALAMLEVLEAPAIAVAPVESAWWVYDPVNEVRTCTNCGKPVEDCRYPSYCPCCGAKMEGGA